MHRLAGWLTCTVKSHLRELLAFVTKSFIFTNKARLNGIWSASKHTLASELRNKIHSMLQAGGGPYPIRSRIEIRELPIDSHSLWFSDANAFPMCVVWAWFRGVKECTGTSIESKPVYSDWIWQDISIVAWRHTHYRQALFRRQKSMCIRIRM